MTAMVAEAKPASGRLKTALLWSLFIIVAASLLALLGGRDEQRYAPLDPANSGVEGARAAAQVLRQEGVEVIEVRTAAALEAAPVDVATTVVVTSTENLGESTAARLLEHAQPGGLLVVEPGSGITPVLGLGSDPYFVPITEPRDADCIDSRFNGLTLDVDFATEYDVLDGCFRGAEGVLLGTNSAGTTVLGAGQILQNDSIVRGDNAAIALRALGETQRVIWYVPSLADLAGDDAIGISALLPDWLRPALLLVGVASLGLIGWRGRRLGPLVSEPTPVEVKAIETTLSRGRLYRKANDRAHATSALRAATRETLRQRLHLPAQTPPDVLTHSLAERLQVPSVEIHELISPQAESPTTDQQLIALANRLAELEEKVRRS